MLADNPTKTSHSDILEIGDGLLLVDELLRLYPDGFPAGVNARIYTDGPLPENEIELTETMAIDADVVYWLVLYPQGLDPGTIILGLLLSLIVGDIVGQIIEDALDDILEDLDSSAAGVASSANNQLRGQRNRIRLGEKIPQIYGEVISFPDVSDDAASTFNTDEFTEFDEFKPAGINLGDQVLIQQFYATDGNADYDRFKIGNVFLSPDETVLLLEASTNNQLVSTLGDLNEKIELIDQGATGDLFGRMFLFNPNDMVVDTGNQTIKRFQSYGVGASDGLGLYMIFAVSVSVGDSFQMRSDQVGLAGTFDILNWTIDTRARSETGIEITIDYTNGSGLVTGTYNSGEAWLYSEDGFRGIETANSANLADLTFSNNSPEPKLFTFKRPELENPGAGLVTEVLRGILNFPRGYTRRTDRISESAIISREIFEIDDDGNKVGAAIFSFSDVFLMPVNNQFLTVLMSVSSAAAQPGRRLALELTALGQPFSALVATDAIIADQFVSAAGRTQIFVTQTNQTGTVDNINASGDIIRLTRISTRGGRRSSAGNFNCRVKRKIPLFNSGTGLFGATAFTRDFADIFMHHAVNVGPIAVSNIDFEELYAIQDAINAADPEDGFFSYTFSNKQAALDSELATICRVARVTLWKEGNRYRFTRDETRSKVGNITSRNMLDAGAKSITLSLPDPFDGVVLEYIDPETGKMATIEYPETSTTRLKRMRIPGIRNFNQAWRRVRYEYLKMISQRISRGITASREANLWSIGDRLTVFDHTRMEITPLASSGSAFRNDTELQFIDTGDVFVCSEKIEVDGTMAAEFFFDHTGDGSIQNILINVDPVDSRRFTIDPSTAPATITLLVDNARQVANELQIGERILIYPAAVSANQLIQDDYLIMNKQPDSLGVILELIRYNADLYQFDGVAPP
jgi:hypothetical protein